MRAVATLVGLALSALALPAAADCDDPFGDPDEVLDLHLRLTRAEWDAIVFDVAGDVCPEYPWHEAELRCGDEEPWLAIVRPIVAEEVGPVWGGRDPFDPSTAPNYQSAFELLQEWVPERDAALRAQLAAEGVDCPEGCPEGAIEPCEHIACEGARACEDGFWTGCRCADPAPGADAGPSAGEDGGTDPGRDAGGPGEEARDGGAIVDGGDAGCGCHSPGATAPIHALLVVLLTMNVTISARGRNRGRLK